MAVRAWFLGAVAAAMGGCVAVGSGSGLSEGIASATRGGTTTTGNDPSGPDPAGPASSSVSGSLSAGEGSTSTGLEESSSGTTAAIDGTQGGTTSTGLDSLDTGSGESSSSSSSSSTGDGSPCDDPPGQMDPNTVEDAQVGVEYEIVFQGPDGVYEYDWFILPWEPEGLEFSVDGQPNAQATMSGIPTEAGDFDFTVIANPQGDECVNADALIVDFTLTVDP